MEIERKWNVPGWPEGFPLLKEQVMRQGYIHTRPTVRIRSEQEEDGSTAYILCVKSSGTLAREEVEVEVGPERFAALERVIGLPLIGKVRRTYSLSGGLHLEVSHVDEGLPTEFYYAEIEFPSVAEAEAFLPEGALADYLGEETTFKKGESMAAYWRKTRLSDADL